MSSGPTFVTDLHEALQRRAEERSPSSDVAWVDASPLPPGLDPAAPAATLQP